ncbi:cohesin domain-containing protein [Cohnella boryungensis]|uniref:Cohesin domain-containing protein n=1 Tax=Cohnella boryungensis TaxID=768479 RepID=A0ABV8SF69_9BACL
MKKLAGLVLSLGLIIGVFAPSASAYPGGLIAPNPVYDDMEKRWSSLYTDGNESSGVGIYIDNSLSYTFSTPQTVKSYKLTASRNFDVLFYDSNNNLLHTAHFLSTSTSTQHNNLAQTVTNVSKVVFDPIQTNSFIYELDVFNTTAPGTPEPLNPTLDVVIGKDKIRVGEQFTSNIELKNVSNIYAEDFKINYDSNLLNYVGFEEVPGYKIYNQPTDQNGTLRFIVASQGEQYGITGEKVFLKLKFTGKAKGTAKIDALECRIADTESEYDLNEDSCLEDNIEVEGIKDVNRSGEYTLVDLAIDGFYYGKTAVQTDSSKHDADQVEDGIIDDKDLLFIVNEMLNNPNYPLNA